MTQDKGEYTNMKASIKVLLLLGVSHFQPAFPQEGYPMNGSWRAELKKAGSGVMEEAIVVIMEWNGKEIHGLIDPGPNSMQIEQASLDPSDWSVHIEAQSKEGQQVAVDGVLENIGSYHREVNGTWSVDGIDYELHMVRQ